jgi:hypothetical protein
MGVGAEEGTPRTGGVVQQVVRGEHYRLGEMFVEVGRIFGAASAVETVREAFSILSEQLDVHFEQEERLYYASIGALRQDLKPAILTISEDHRRFRLELAAIADQLERGDVEGAAHGFEALTTGFRRHEAMEEALLRRVDEGIRQAP